ncbi:Chitin synthase, class 3 [Thoreauomyces humboldtii]|nr:Chitin synthase, class 3 [Thoreauomyces humboldtii]
MHTSSSQEGLVDSVRLNSRRQPPPPAQPRPARTNGNPPAPRTRLSVAFPQPPNAVGRGEPGSRAKASSAASSALPLHPVSVRPQPGPPAPVGRKKSLVRRDRSLNRGRRMSTLSGLGKDATLRRRQQPGEVAPLTFWRAVVNTLTFYLPAPLLRVCGMKDADIQAAFKEKIALCIIIALCMCFVGFITFFFNRLACYSHDAAPILYSTLQTSGVYFAVRGGAYLTSDAVDAMQFYHKPLNINVDYPQVAGKDLSPIFRSVSAECQAFALPCTVPGVWPGSTTLTSNPQSVCHNTVAGLPNSRILSTVKQRTFFYMDFSDIENRNEYVVFNGNVWDVTRLSEISGLDSQVLDILNANRGKDSTKAFQANDLTKFQAKCLDQTLRIAKVDATGVGCAISNVVVYISLIVIIGTVGVRFLMAMTFQWVIGWRMGERDKGSRVAEDLKRRRQELSASGGQSRVPVISSPSDAKPAHDQIELSHVKGGKDTSEVRISQLKVRNPSQSTKVEGPATASSQPTSLPLHGGPPMESPRRSMSSSAKSHKSMRVLEPVRGPNGAMMRPTLPSVDLPDMDLPTTNAFTDLELSVPYAKADPTLNDPTLMHTLVMVPCYSEGYDSLRATLDSLAKAYYPSTHKTLFVIADGLVQGSGNDRSTPDYLVDMMEVDERFVKDDPRKNGLPEAFSYVAIADGSKRKNFARVYAGWYRYAITEESKSSSARNKSHSANMTGTLSRTLTKRKSGKVPMILVVKCGNEEERDPVKGAAKPGNRGKRDSQVLLMQFLSKVMFDDRMTELEFDIFHKLWTITGLNPEMYETVMMVDADTRIYPDSLTHLIACLKRDPKVMGVCGETKIYNKWDSWVTMIQVYEYYISHHLSKAFESVFGGVTCLPGCFSAYRIKAPKNGQWVPILANPDVVEEYSENVVETLHTKNLLLLGEDRFLTTLMLKAFPKRRNVFVPQAICKTVVPDTFSVLLSQRRRWINSTIHNLLELVLVRDLCGTFCFSMQFVIFMELIGSVILPAATVYTIYLIVEACLQRLQLLPLIMLVSILGLPALLILLTVRRVVYLFWFLVYMAALPLWQFVLPLYAFWHFDDFSWGDTRVVSGEEGKKAADHSKRDGEFDYNGIVMKRWSEWIRERATSEEIKRRNAVAARQQQQHPGPYSTPYGGPPGMYQSRPPPQFPGLGYRSSPPGSPQPRMHGMPPPPAGLRSGPHGPQGSHDPRASTVWNPAMRPHNVLAGPLDPRASAAWSHGASQHHHQQPIRQSSGPSYFPPQANLTPPAASVPSSTSSLPSPPTARAPPS